MEPTLLSLELTTISLIAIGLAADAFAVSLTSGLAIRHIKLNKAVKIALFFGGFQAFMPLLGWGMGLGFREAIASIDHWIVFGLLAFLGGRTIYEAWNDSDEEKPFNPLKIETLLVLSVATSLDALAAGLGFSVLKMPIAMAVSIVGSVTFGLCFLGVYLGHYFGDWFQTKVEIIGGLILMGIGTKILWEHLSLEGFDGLSFLF
ncbi:manganese efflux pump MntP family protein [Baaleninema sp.]|uniref:manganese efflux pump MntP n=1 Tax=Baaleninema sp. TaxID=3101197 RepID=UPI003D0060C2